jgi:hypothetical protein
MLGHHSLHTIVCVPSYTGSFSCGGPADLPIPGLHIEGVGHVSVPLQPAAISAIKRIATRAPYGKGQETLVDTAVRDSLQVSSTYDHARVLNMSSTPLAYLS